MPGQTSLFVWNNQNLFSNNYLENRLPSAALWNEQKEKAAIVFDELKKIYESTRPLELGPGKEAALEDKFIRPILKLLGFERDVQPTTERRTKKRPDYALFRDKESLELACKDKANLEKYYSHPITILEAKYWGRRLNDADPKDTIDRRDPTAQTVKYLDDVYHASGGRIQWAILTNGKLWRLFYYRASSRSGNYFEIDLEELILRGDADKFLYFYLFFSKDAFLQDAVTGKTWLNLHLEETEAYASRVSGKLKNLIFDHIFEGLAAGFMEYRRNELAITKESEQDLRDIFKGCLTLLYRLLFLLYAESRDLLPADESSPYYRKSLKKLKKDIAEELKKSGLGGMSKNAHDYWSRIESLFRIIDKGDRALNIPVYNGGLFEAQPDSFLSKHKLSDPFIADAIELLTVDQDAESAPSAIPFIDYSSLSVRHLGDIYEGLLEFHIRIADEEIMEVKEKGKQLWKKRSEIKVLPKTGRNKLKGEAYIENSNHERKATGSYYTPHYIVEYIVNNTVGPVLDDRLNRVKTLSEELDTLYEKQRKQLKKPADWKYWEHPGEPKGEHITDITYKEHEIFVTLFDIKVLDPAMGSGHFLVHTVDFITDKIITFLADYPDSPIIRKIADLKRDILGEIERQGVSIDESKLTEVNLIKRMVMKQCIYGVDLNEMAVELAKLSLWLDSFTLGAPLSFLDHHLKYGNSLIGIFDISDVIIPGSEVYGKVQRALSFMLQVSELTDATVTEAKTSHDLFRQGREAIEPIIRRFDAATAKYFMESGWTPRIEQLAYTLNFEGEPFKEIVESCKKALTIARDKRFFHWKVEFSEVFYTDKGEKENQGFDCVIGNPPYDVLSELEQERQVEHEKNFYNGSSLYRTAVGGKLNFYRLFIALSLALLKKEGRHGFIVPMALLADKQAKPLREYILTENCFIQIEAFPQKDDPNDRVFQDAKLSTCAYSLLKNNHASFSVRIHSGKYIDEQSTTITLTPSLVEEFDLENMSIPSYPSMTSCDFNLALKLINISKKALLGNFAPSQQGEVNLTTHSQFLTDITRGQIVLRGAHINRYEFQTEPKQGEPMYLNVQEFLSAHREGTKAHDYKYPRIGYQRGAAIDNWRRIIATIVDKDSFCSDTINYITKPREYDLFTTLALLNSSLWEWRFRLTSTNNHVNSYEIDAMPLPPISFTTPGPKRKKRVAEAIERYKGFMLDLERGHGHENKDNSTKQRRALADGTLDSGKEALVHGEHSGTGERVHGVRGRARKPEDAQRVSEESAEYASTTRYLESSLGIKSYAELAPYLAQGVERVMAALLDREPAAIKITPEFICGLHKDAFRELFPSWAGCYRDREVTVGKHKPPPYFEVPILMRQYCDDLESRLASVGEKPALSDVLLETLAFAEGRFLSIHPFLDFNGRVARMLLFALLYRLDLPPIPLIPDENDKAGRKDYFAVLSAGDECNWLPLVEVWKRRLGIGGTA